MKSAVIVILASIGLFAAGPARSQEAVDPILSLAAKLENRLDARVGFAIYDLESEQSWEYRADERFAMASTFKVLACAALLAGGETLTSTTVTINAEDLLAYAPVTERLVGKEVEASALCEATMRTSDNTAANKVLEVLGGPDAVTNFVRTIGDQTTRLDRWEPELNEAQPGSALDTTTPHAMAASLRSIVLGEVLPTAEQEQIRSWLRSNEVGGPLLRAGVPANWRVGDRTGAGGHGTRGIVAVMWPPGSKPVIAAIYLTETTASIEDRNAAIAEIGATLAAVLSK